MRFWDTSAVVPLLLTESATRPARELLNSDPSVVVWWTTRTECISALTRQTREGNLTPVEESHARRILAALASQWSEVAASERVRQRAERILGLHSLRAADAFQLAAALVWSKADPSEHALVSFDERLRDAAAREGFDVLPAG